MMSPMTRALPKTAAALAALVLLGGLAGCSDDEPVEEGGPVEVTVGEEFSYDGFTVPAGWEYDTLTEQVALEEQTHPLVRARVVNDGDEERAALFELVFAREGDALSTIRCNSTTTLAPGATGDLFCPGLGQPVPEGYDTIVVQDVTRG